MALLLGAVFSLADSPQQKGRVGCLSAHVLCPHPALSIGQVTLSARESLTHEDEQIGGP